ncbi:MAG: hypothetical protein HC883_01135, partial [Bdellovibrionaceae bacterium]|nr:hypothetical protein [Pseudobdellovibrionaceae bacterium]
MLFDEDIALVNRHLFVSKDGSRKAKVNNCYFEHVQSGEIIPVVDVEFRPYRPDGVISSFFDEDFALVRLAWKPSRGHAIPADLIEVDGIRESGEKLLIFSNYAGNLKSTPEALTMTTCFTYGRFNLKSGDLSRVYST